MQRTKQLVVGIRREHSQRIWERRAPLTPDAVAQLISQKGVKVQFVPCAKRVFRDAEYVAAGAEPVSSLHFADIILGIKEPPLSEVTYGRKVHFMFSHTIKGQHYNMDLLDRFVQRPHGPPERHPRLVDFELLTDESGQRTVGFGWFAGVAGALESLSAMAHSHLELGIATPFLYTPRPHTLPSLDRLRSSLREIGNTIAAEGTHPLLGPVVIGVTGNGKVAQGCLSILSELPIVKVPVSQLESLVRNPDTDLKKVYLVHVQPEDFLAHKNNTPYTRQDYYASPQSYESQFNTRVAPYLTLLLNGIGWSPSFPRLMSNEQLLTALNKSRHLAGDGRMTRGINIGDISCDVKGGLEVTKMATTLSEPVFKVKPEELASLVGASTTLAKGMSDVSVMSVDILPASIPLDASNSFSSALLPYLESFVASDPLHHIPTPSEDPLVRAIDRATVANRGKLVGRHQWLEERLEEQVWKGTSTAQPQASGVSASQPAVPTNKLPEAASKTPARKILMLGSGLVAQPAVDYIAQRPDIELMIASNSLSELQKLVGPHTNVKYRVIDASSPVSYAHLVEESDVVISLLPATLHPGVGELCVAAGKHLVTASYVSPAMEALDASAKKQGVLLLNEIGLDPGLDHCSAMDILDRIKHSSKSLASFTSFCGGLPRFEDAANVPLRYKFSWSPLGVLKATGNPAKFLLNSQLHEVNGEDLLKTVWPHVPISDKIPFEGIPNRDSLQYKDVYGLSDLSTLVRGTLRYPGFSSLMRSFQALGLLNDKEKITLRNWNSFIAQSLFASKQGDDQYLPPMASIVAESEVGDLEEALRWLGLIRPSPLLADIIPSNPSAMYMPPLPSGPQTPMEIFSWLLMHKLRYEPHEKDTVVLAHEMVAIPKAEVARFGPKFKLSAYKGPMEVYTSSLITTGTDRANVGFRGERPASAMARTVGIPLAISALLVADGKLDGLVGVHRPVMREVYKPVLRRMTEIGLGFDEKIIKSKVVKSTMSEVLRRGWSLAASGLTDRTESSTTLPDFVDVDRDCGWKEAESVEWKAETP